MCGLVGVAGNLTAESDKILKTLLKLDVIRGEDSTGVAFIPKLGEPLIAKVLGTPFDLLGTAVFEKGINKWNRAIIGHNRFATKGQVIRANAHPFEFGNVIGAHNGTLDNQHVLANYKDYAVDSQALYAHISEFGVDNAVDQLRGAWALTWWDKKEETMNFLRNKERPLHIAFTKDGKLMFWASEKWMIEVAVGRSNLQLEHIGFLEENKLISVPIARNGDISEWNEREVKSNAAPFIYQGQTGRSYSPTTNTRTFTPTTQQQKNVYPLNIPLKGQGVETKDPKKQAQPADGYAGTKGVKVRCNYSSVDIRGATYLSCSDMNNLKCSIRLYVNREEISPYLGKEFIVDIGKLYYNDREQYYYKVEYSSVTAVAEEEEEETFVNSKGKLVNIKEWLTTHGKCCWCDIHIDPKQSHEFTRGGDVLCQDCMKDSEVKQYI